MAAEKNPKKDLFKAIKRANRQAEIDAGLVGRFKSKTILDKRKEEARNRCRQSKSLRDPDL